MYWKLSRKTDDLFTTAARLAGATNKIPGDRVIDGINQTALFLLGEGHGRRNMMLHYSGGTLGAIRFEDFKVHLKGKKWISREGLL